MLIYCSLTPPTIAGEWDDYSLPAISIIKEHNFSIDKQDIENFKKVFLEWSKYADIIELSGYKTNEQRIMNFVDWYKENKELCE